MGNSIKYKRGTIWLYKDNSYTETNLGRKYSSHIQSNSRPVLIVSSDFGNTHSPVLNVVPLTTANKDCSVNVSMETEDGLLNYILCNQIKTIDAKDLVHYISTVDDETMEKVEKTINHVLGISAPRIEKSIKDIETLIENVAKMKFHELSTRDEFDNIVENIAKGLENTYSKLMEQYIENINSAEKRILAQAPELAKVTKTHNDVKSEESEIKDMVEESKKRKYTISNKPRGYWTPERKAQYVKDFNSHTIQWMMNTYKIDNEVQVKKRYSNYKWELNKKG